MELQINSMNKVKRHRQWKVHILAVQPYQNWTTKPIRDSFHLSIAHVWYEYLISNWTWNCQSSLIENVLETRLKTHSQHYFILSLHFGEQKMKSTRGKKPPCGVMTENWLWNVPHSTPWKGMFSFDNDEVNEHNNGLYESLWVDTIICQTVRQECWPQVSFKGMYVPCRDTRDGRVMSSIFLTWGVHSKPV